MAFLLQAPLAPTAADQLFWPVIAVVLLVAVIGALVRRVSRDGCLKLLQGHHATLLFEDRPTVWGDLTVLSQGLEVGFDAVVETPEGLAKSSQLVYDDELGSAVALLRVDAALTLEERRERLAQVRRTFRPSLTRRTLRSLRNLANMLRDAVTTAIGLVVGRAARGGFVGAAVRGRSQDVNALGGKITELVTNAYEPLLEAHVGRPVILELRTTKDAKAPLVEIPGYLVDYTAKHVAVFSVDHPRGESMLLDFPADADVAARAGLRVAPDPGGTTVTALGAGALVVSRALLADRTLNLEVVLLPGTSLRLPAWPPSFRLEIFRAHGVDVVCPRARARVRHGSGAPPPARPGWTGTGPVLSA